MAGGPEHRHPGRLTFHFCGALAEFERDLIRERTRAGLAATRARKGGRKHKVDDRMLARAAELMRERTVGINEICRIVGGGKTTLSRCLTPDDQRRGDRVRMSTSAPVPTTAGLVATR